VVFAWPERLSAIHAGQSADVGDGMVASAFGGIEVPRTLFTHALLICSGTT
jgi:hypothetical protein